MQCVGVNGACKHAYMVKEEMCFGRRAADCVMNGWQNQWNYRS